MATPKVKLGKAPKNFTKAVSIILLSGEAADIDISYIYRTRSQFAELVDEKIAAEKAELDKKAAEVMAAAEQVGTIDDSTEKPVPIKTVAEWFKEADDGGVKFVLKIANGWDLDDPFSEESLLQLEDENPGSLAAIAAKYRQTVAEARVKNS